MKNRREFRLVLTSCVLSCFAAVVVTTALFIRMFGGVELIADVAKYASVAGIINERYIGKADFQAVSDAGYRAMISELEDRWSYYMSADEYASYRLYTGNSYAGIGVTISTDDTSGGQRIESVNADSPAERADLRMGQVIIVVDNEDTRGMTAADVRALIGAKLGAELMLTVIDLDGEVLDVEVNCEVIYTSPVTHSMLENDIGYIRIKNFEAGCSDAFEAAVNELLDLDVRGIVIDVRMNPGGRVTELLGILDLLLPEGDIFVKVDNQGQETVDRSGSSCVELPIAVLADKNSYSAAEFFAAALSEYGRALVIGERTTGKGRAQGTYALGDGSAVHISNSVYLTPINRVDLSEIGGLAPDIEVIPDDESRLKFQAGRLEPQDDAQLQAAIDSLPSIRYS